MSNPGNTDKLHVSTLVALCAAYGLRNVVISPGSRNAPLIIAFHHQPEIKCFVIPDERSAAYFAIGIAQYIKQAVGIICTSGTAALNYTPALAEAFYQKLPLIAITADRPPEWIDQMDGQTINQTGIYTNFTCFQAQLPVEAFTRHEVWHLERIIRDGFLALKHKSQPIHFNVPIREPFYNQNDQQLVLSKSSTIEPLEQAYFNDDQLNIKLANFQRVLIILGMRRPDPMVSKFICQLARKKNIVIFSETLSNIDCDEVFQTSDVWLSTIQNKEMPDLIPDLVISFGDILLSKPLKQWIRSLENTRHWIVTEDEKVPDVFQHIDLVMPYSAGNFFSLMLDTVSSKRNAYYVAWKTIYDNFDLKHKGIVNSMAWSDMHAFKILSEKCPGNTLVHLGNSSPVRYAQFFRWHQGIHFYSNRGTAGIDGTTSTAIGMASQTSQNVILITGDVSFLYDSNALWNNYKKPNFKMVVLNNKGGNLFGLIPGPTDTGLLNDYFTTHINVSINKLCKAFEIGYYLATNETTLISGFDKLLGDECCALLEIETDPVTNTRVWKEYFKMMKNYELHNS